MNGNGNTLGEQIKHYRTLRKFTLEQLAERLDISLSFIQTIELDINTPSLEVFLRIAAVLDVQPGLLLRDGEPQPFAEDYNHLSLSSVQLIKSVTSAISIAMTDSKPALSVNIGKRIFEYRIKKGLSRKNLAAKMLITADQLRKIEVGVTSTRLKPLVLAVQALDIPIEYIFQDEDKASSLCALNVLLNNAREILSEKQYDSLNKVIENLLLLVENE